MLDAHLLEIGKASHVPVGLDDLDDRGRRLESGELAEVDRALGLAGPDEDPAVAGPQRVDVTGSDEVVGPGLGVGHHADGDRPIARTDAGADPCRG